LPYESISAGFSRRIITDYTATEVSQDIDGRWVARPFNIGSARANGLELETKLPLTLLIPSGPAIDLRGSFSRNWSSVAQVPGPGNRIAEQVPLQASLSADYAIDPVTVGGSFVIRQGAWTTVTTTQSTFSNTRRDLDIYARWKMSKQSQLRVTAANVFAQESVRSAQFRDLAGSATRTTVTPGYVVVRALLETRF
jgi:outer membrane receptor protein involved in Fe transport